jgi:hypothetical protein
MIDPIASLAFSIYSSPGVYALLLGSGVSKSAGIPTGWEIVTDLAQKLAAIDGQNNIVDPIGWFTTRYNKPPEYSSLLEALVQSPAERQSALRSYFERTEEERQQKLKLPTEAHRRIASLVKQGFVKVIVSTNFDRLLEQALEAEGIIPYVVSSDDQVEGMQPLQHNRITLLKINGDYLDSRIRNTSEELREVWE